MFENKDSFILMLAIMNVKAAVIIAWFYKI